jgi:hypothetical protein
MGRPSSKVAEGAAETGLEGVVPGARNPVDDAPDALGGDGVRVVLALDQDEAPIAAVFPVLGEDGVGGGAGAGEGIEDDGVGVG